MNHKRIFVVGGAGFLGYHTCLELASRGKEVTCMAMPNESVDDSLASQVNLVRADIDQLDDTQLAQMMSGHDAVIYAAGPDDRVELPAGVNATEFFQTQLVDRTTRVLRIAKEQGVSKAVIFGSYFSYINNHGLAGIKPGQLERHPYIQARVKQAQNGFALGGEDFSVITLNIPYVFGTAPGKEPIWRHVFVERFGQAPKIFYGSGGTTMISARKIAVCVAQALEYASHGEELALGSKNIKFKPMIEQLLQAASIDKPVASVPTWLLSVFMKREWKKAQKANLDSGLDMRYLAKDILGRDFYVDFEATDRRLQMEGYVDDIDGAITETGQKMSQKSQ